MKEREVQTPRAVTTVRHLVETVCVYRNGGVHDGEIAGWLRRVLFEPDRDLVMSIMYRQWDPDEGRDQYVLLSEPVPEMN